MKIARDFRFKKFTVSQDKSTHKVGTDGVLLGAWVNVQNVTTALDVGTGTGVIALMLAQRTPESTIIDAIEIQKDDAEQAKQNVAGSPWNERIYVHHCRAQDFKPEKKYDLIVSNPPYFKNSWLPPSEDRTKVRHTQTLSFEELLATVGKLLKDGGRHAVILPVTEGLEFINLARTFSLYCIRICEFKTRLHKPVERLLLEFARKEAVIHKETVLLYAAGEKWSDEYVKLTGDFYLDR
jgi:tRNA1Val (adenine37-N6)-methyltransferase